ncbi:MAG: hypothetical protein JWR59_1994 [Brevundimonas sp.]|nr:hypothetical protein [Brevundimonas sp.]
MVMGGLVNIPAQRILYWAIAAILVGLNGTLLLLLAFQS